MWPLYSHRQSPCWLIWRERRRTLFFLGGDKSFTNPKTHDYLLHRNIYVPSICIQIANQRGIWNGDEILFFLLLFLFSLIYLSNGCYWYKTHICICWLRIHDLAVPQLFLWALVLFTRESHNNLIGRTRIMMSFIIRLFEIRAVHNFGCVDGKQFI